jgi:nucleolar protein 9
MSRPFYHRYARRPEQWRASQTSKETTLKQFEAEFGSNSKSVAQNFEEKFPSQSPKKKRKQEKPDKITEDASNRPAKSAKATSQREFSSKKLAREGTSMASLKESGKRKSPGFLSDKPSLKKQKHHRPTSGKPDGKRFVRGSSSTTPFVKNSGKPKRCVAELADLAGKERLTAAEVRKLLKSEMPGAS